MLGIGAIGQLPVAGFPVNRPAVGWFPEWDEYPPSRRRRHTPEELEGKLARQKENTFGRRWFDDYIAAQNAALARARDTKSERLREKLEEAVTATSQEVADAIDEGRAPIDFNAALNAAANAKRTSAAIKHSETVLHLVNEEYDEEEDIAILLLLS